MQAEIPILGPPGPVKNEEIFLPFESHSKLLTWLKRLSILVIPLALYQISAGFFLTSQHPSSLNSGLSFAGIFSLAFLSFVLYWTFITTGKEEKVHSLYQKTKDQLSSFDLLIFSALKLTQIPVLIANLYFQQEYITDLITAQKSIVSPWDSIQQPSSDLNNGMMMTYAITEGIFFIYSLLAIITLSKFSLQPKKLCSIFIFVFNAILLGTSLSLAFTAYRAWTPQNYPRFDSLFPRSMLMTLLGLGGFSAMLTLPMWFINHKKWRVGFLAGFLLTLLTGLLLVSFSNSAYSHSQSIYQTYKSTENSREWSLNMGLVSQKEIEAAGCPSKYVSQGYCETDSIISAWESASTNGIRPYCLNEQCAGILGQLYADQFLHISNLSFATAIGSLLLSIGMLYSMKTRGRGDSSKPRTKGRHNKWLFTLFVVGLCVTLVYGFAPNDSIEEFKDSQNYADQTNSGESDYLNWINAATNVMNKAGLISTNNNSADVEYAIAQMMTARIDRFLIMTQDFEANKLILAKKGGNDQTYERFLESLSSTDPQIALVQMPIDDDKEMLIEVIWTPENAPIERNNQLLKQYAKDSRGCFYNENLKVMVVTASKLEELSLDALEKQLPSLNKLKQAYSQVSDEIIEGTEKQISYITRRIQSDLTLESQSVQDIASMIRDRKYKYLVFELKEDSESMAISQRGNWGGDYNDLIKSMNPNKPQIALVFLRLDGTVKLTEILYLPESASDLEKQLFTEYYVNKNSAEAQEVGPGTVVARNAKQLELKETLKGLYPLEQTEPGNVFDLTKDSGKQGKGKEYFFREDVKNEFERFLKEEEKAYKYVILRWNNENEVGIERIGSVWKNYIQFLYDLHTETANSPRLIFYNVEIEGESYPMMILWFPEGQTNDMLKERFRSIIEEFEGKTYGYIVSGEPQLSIQDIVSPLANANKIKETTTLRLKNQDNGLLDANAPNMAFMKTLKMMPRGVTFLTTLEDWDDQLSLQTGRPMTLDQPGTPSAADLTESSPRMLTARVLEVNERTLLIPTVDFLRAPAAWAPPVFYVNYLRAPNALPPPIDTLRAPNAVPPPVDYLRAPNAVPPPVDSLRAPNALPPPIDTLRAPNAVPPPVDYLRAPNAVPPPVDSLRAPNALPPPIDTLRAPGALRPPSQYLKISPPYNPPLSYLRSFDPYSSNDLLSLFGASLSPPNFMLKSSNALTELWTPPFLSENKSNHASSLGEKSFQYSTLRFFPTFQLTELFDFFDDFTLNQTSQSNIHVADGVNTTIQDMIANHKYSYIIVGLDASLTNLSIVEQGKAANSYEAFLQKFNKDRSQIAIIDLSVENTSKFVLIIYVPDSASQSEKDTFNNYIVPQASIFTKTQGVPVLIARTVQETKLANLLKYAFSLPQDKSTNTTQTQPTLLRRRGIQGSQQRISPVVFHLKAQYIAEDVESVLNEIVVGRKYKYILLDWNTTTRLLEATKRAPKNTSYDEFLKEFQVGKSRLALLDFGYEGKDIPVLISWGSELVYSQPWEAQAYQLLLTEATNLNIPYYEPRELTSLRLPNLVDYLFTFWPLQINSYTKYTSNQLLSVLQNSPDSGTLESILKPIYPAVSSKGESVLTEMLLRRKYKYLLFKEVEESGDNKLLFVKNAPQSSTTQDFLNDIKGNGNQLALLYLEFAGQDRIVALVMTDPATLEKNYINYARIASAAEVYDIPTAYISSPEALDIEQLTQFTFADDILRILETLKVDTGVQDYWTAAQNGTSSKGYVIIRLQDNNSKIKIEKSKLGEKVTYADFQKELNTKKPFWSILNTADMTEKARLISWIPADTDLPSKILYKNAENILVTSLPGSKVYSNPDLIPN